MDTRQLEYFLQVYWSGSFTKASERLFISEQGLSKAIGRLETEFGVKLFNRSTTGAIPTAAGIALHAKATELIADLHSLSSTILEISGASQPILHVAVTSPAVPVTDGRMSYQAIEQYKSEHPEINLIFEQRSDDSCYKMLMEGSLDVVCMTGRNLGDGFMTQENDRNESVLVISNDSPLLPAEALTLADIAAQPIVAPTDSHTITQHISEWFDSSNLKPQFVFVGNSFAALLQAVYRNKGIVVTIMGPHLASVDKSLATIVPVVAGGYLWRSIWAYSVVNPNRQLIESFIDYMLAIPI